MAHLGYSIYHDRAVQQSAVLERQLAVKAAYDQQRRLQGKAAWDASVKTLDSDLRSWIGDQIKSRGDRSVYIDWAWVKAYEHGDIEWKDDRHLVVHGFISASPEHGERETFSWLVPMTLLDDGGWGKGEPSFSPAGFPKDVFTVTIKTPRLP